MSEWRMPKLKEGKLLVRDCLINRKELFLPLNIREGFIQITENDQNTFMGTGEWGKSTFKAGGGFNLGDSGIEMQEINLSSVSDVNQVMSAFLIDHKFPAMFMENLPWNASISRETDYWICQGEVDLSNMNLENDTLKINTEGEGAR